MRRLIVLAMGAVFLVSGSAFAQESRGEVSGGWRYIRADEENFPKGWYFDAAGHVTDMISIVGDVGGNYKSFDDDIDFSVHTFMGGVRVRADIMNPNVVPFAQVLGGAARTKVDFGSLGDESFTDGVLELGGGVNVSGAGSVGVRVYGAYVRVFEEGEGTNVFRLNVGVNIPF